MMGALTAPPRRAVGFEPPHPADLSAAHRGRPRLRGMRPAPAAVRGGGGRRGGWAGGSARQRGRPPTLKRPPAAVLRCRPQPAQLGRQRSAAPLHGARQPAVRPAPSAPSPAPSAQSPAPFICMRRPAPPVHHPLYLRAKPRPRLLIGPAPPICISRSHLRSGSALVIRPRPSAAPAHCPTWPRPRTAPPFHQSHAHIRLPRLHAGLRLPRQIPLAPCGKPRPQPAHTHCKATPTRPAPAGDPRPGGRLVGSGPGSAALTPPHAGPAGARSCCWPTALG